MTNAEVCHHFLGTTQERTTLLSCEDEVDKYRCDLCGAEWQESCNFDDNYS